jgi:hypothetical protein
VRSVEVFRRGADWLGWCAVPGARVLNPGTAPLADLAWARTLLAGPLAELLYARRPALGAGADELVLAQGIVAAAAAKLGTGPDGLMWAILTRVMETLNTHRPTLDALTQVLLRRRKVKQVELARLLRPVRGPRA